MTVPDFQTMMLPVLKVVGDGRAVPRRDVSVRPTRSAIAAQAAASRTAVAPRRPVTSHRWWERKAFDASSDVMAGLPLEEPASISDKLRLSVLPTLGVRDAFVRGKKHGETKFNRLVKPDAPVRGCQDTIATVAEDSQQQIKIVESSKDPGVNSW
jgi:hypothetical protein